ncbi:uncharacterized protein LOC142325585 [Lycorma delicatula]|uniref:uncharacterized protein LOC142325585 n=1 Tax=Lycorma delicatula TaxID=130591 RepID=UPI003F5171E4
MENLVSADILPFVKCCFINDELLREKEKIDITICCSDGNILEIYNKKVISCCNTLLLNPSKINPFYSYDPLIKYYIIQEDSEIIVIKRIESLNVFKKFSNIQKYDISDFLEIGKPQVKILLNDEMEPIITDFSENLKVHNETKETQLLLNLSSKLNIMKLSLEEISDNIKKKREFCGKALSQCKTAVSTSLIQCEDSWQKIINGYWIYCLPVKNISDEILTNFYLFDNNIRIETKIITQINNDGKSFQPFSAVTCLSPNVSGYVIGILKEPDFELKEEITISFSLIYNISNNNEVFKELKLPIVVLKLSDILNNSLGLFNSNIIALKDIIVITSINVEVMFEVTLKNDHANDFYKILKDKLFFSRLEIESINYCCYIIKPHCSSALSGVVLFIKELSQTYYLLYCYAKNRKQISLLKRSLHVLSLSILSINQKNSYKNDVPILAAVNSLDDEFKNFTESVRYGIPSKVLPLKEESNLKFTALAWKELQNYRLQLNTDLKFQEAFMGSSK